MRRLLACLLVLTLAVPATACLWDYDTLQMERQRFPGALELIVGKFLRHSQPFYEWRVKDRRKTIAAHDLDMETLTKEELARAYDDLAVALDKLKRHDEAIDVIREKADRMPNVGEYETHANLGTFLAHSGRLEDGVAELKKAIEINPDAHFGREKYQVLVIEYVLEKRGEEGATTFPLDSSFRNAEGDPPFVAWLLRRQGMVDDGGKIQNRQQAADELAAANKGVLGMMHFGDFRSPVLLETLGDLLLKRHNQQLAARAYLRAAEAVDSHEARRAYRKLAEGALADQANAGTSQGLSLSSLEDQLAREVHEADDWFERTIVYDEKLWIERSPDPDASYWNKYGGQEIRVGHARLPAAKFAFKGLPFAVIVALGIGLLATIGGVATLIAWRRKRPTGYDGESI